MRDNSYRFGLGYSLHKSASEARHPGGKKVIAEAGVEGFETTLSRPLKDSYDRRFLSGGAVGERVVNGR
jgi:hypothetical protein